MVGASHASFAVAASLMLGCAQLPPTSEEGSGGSAVTGGGGDSRGGSGGVGGAGGVGGSPSGEPVDPEPNQETEVSVVCTTSELPGIYSRLPWELTVDPGPIEGGSSFSAIFEGVALFSESFLDTAQAVIEGGIREVLMLEAKATVNVYEGATGPPAVLGLEPRPHQCAIEDEPGMRRACDPANDLRDEGVGVVGNSDCQPIGPTNPCGRFVPLPTSDDCSQGGVCWNLDRDEAGSICSEDDFCKEGAKTQCEGNGFCITGPLRLPFAPTVQDYVADPSGEVRFGWHETESEEWQLPEASAEEPLGPTGLRFYIGSLPVNLECVLGGQELGLFGPLPRSDLPPFLVSERGCTGSSRACPSGFIADNGGICRFSEVSPVVVMEDPQAEAGVCDGLPFVPRTESYLSIDDAKVLESPSLIVQATIEAKNVEDEACLSSHDVIADINFLDSEEDRLENTVLIFNHDTEVAVSEVNNRLRSTSILPGDVRWSATPDDCCVRTFQTLWEVRVGQCEGW